MFYFSSDILKRVLVITIFLYFFVYLYFGNRLFNKQKKAEKHTASIRKYSIRVKATSVYTVCVGGGGGYV